MVSRSSGVDSALGSPLDARFRSPRAQVSAAGQESSGETSVRSDDRLDHTNEGVSGRIERRRRVLGTVDVVTARKRRVVDHLAADRALPALRIRTPRRVSAFPRRGRRTEFAAVYRRLALRPYHQRAAPPATRTLKRRRRAPSADSHKRRCRRAATPAETPRHPALADASPPTAR